MTPRNKRGSYRHHIQINRIHAVLPDIDRKRFALHKVSGTTRVSWSQVTETKQKKIEH